MHDTLVSRTHTASAMAPPSVRRRAYLVALMWSFSVFNATRLLGYMPTIWAIHVHGDSSQHSLWTWVAWAGANATMAAWLYEQDARRMRHAALFNVANAVLCLLTVAVICWYRP